MSSKSELITYIGIASEGHRNIFMYLSRNVVFTAIHTNFDKKLFSFTIAQKIDNNRTHQIIIINHHFCYDLTKQLSYYLYFFSFLFLFFSYLDLLYKKGIWKSITGQCHMSECYKIISHDGVT